MSLLQWLLQKIRTRFQVLIAIIIPTLILVLMFNGVNLYYDASNALAFLLLSLGYLLFWFVLAFLINLAGSSSARNALTLLACWIGLVLLIPSIVNQLAGSLYPVPSRAQMIIDMRMEYKEAGKKQDEILDEYLRNHPELGTVNRDEFEFWQGYFASQELVRKEMEPVLSQFDRQLSNQQQWVKQIRFASPAILLQDGFNELAQTSTRHYRGFRKQVIKFAAEWRAFFMPMVFKNEKVTEQTMNALPEFSYSSSVLTKQIMVNILAVMIYSAFLFIIALDVYYRRSMGSLIMGESS